MALSRKAQAIIEVIGEDKVTDMLKQIQKETEKTGEAGKSSWEKFQVGIMALNANVQSVIGGVQQLGEHMKAGAQAMAIEGGFNKAFKDSASVMAEFQHAVSGTVDDTTVQRFAANAKRLGMSVGQTARAFELATKASIETGTEFGELMEQLLEGIGTGSKSAFEKLGIVTAEFEQALERAAKNLGKTTAELDGAEKAAIRTNVALDALGDSFGSVNVGISEMGEIKKLEADWNNFVSDLQVGLMKVAKIAYRIPQNLAIAYLWMTGEEDDESPAIRAERKYRLTKQLRDKRKGVVAQQRAAEDVRARIKAKQDDDATGPHPPSGWNVPAGRLRTPAEAWERRQLMTTGKRRLTGEAVDRMQANVKEYVPVSVERARTLQAKQVAAHASMIEMYETASTVIGADGGAVIARNLFRKIQTLGKEWGWPAGLDPSSIVMGDPSKKKGKKPALSEWQIEMAKWIEAGGDPQFVQRTLGLSKSAMGPQRALAPIKDVTAEELRYERMAMETRRGVDASMGPAMAGLEDFVPEAPLGEADQERKRAILDNMIEFHSEMTMLNRDLVGSALQDSYDQLGGFGDSLVAMNDLFSVELPRFADMWTQMGEAGASGAQMLAASAPKMLDMSKRIVGGLVKDKKGHSIVLGLFEIAQGIASAVTPGRQWESAGHFAAATAYFVAAGKSGGAGKGAAKTGGGAAGRGFTPSASGTGIRAPQINIHIGTLIGDDEVAIRNLASKLDRHSAYTGGGSDIP